MSVTRIVVLHGDVLGKCDVLAFRFAKLQDLLGTKIFRLFLAYLGYPAEGQDFLTRLRELEKTAVGQTLYGRRGDGLSFRKPYG